MNVIPKPVGNELRSRRAQKDGSARRVTPLDALWSAYERVTGRKDIHNLFVCWYEPGETGLPVLKWEAAADHPRGITALIADAAYETQVAARQE